MALSSEITALFAKTVVTEEKKKAESKAPAVLNGTIVADSGSTYVQIDGSDQLTPVDTTSRIKDGQRVTVMIKNHSAVVTGNLSAPSANQGDLDDLGSKIDEFDNIIADVVTTEHLEAINANIEKLVAEDVVIKNSLSATEASIKNLTADNAVINGKLEAAEAEIDSLDVEKLDVSVADIKFATIENLEATNANIHNLEADYGDFKVVTTEKLETEVADIDLANITTAAIENLSAKFANIDFANIGNAAIEHIFSDTGLIKDLVVGDQTITGELVGVTIKGDLIEGNTIVADKLVVKGEDGLYYKLNFDGETIEQNQTEYNSLNGSIITAKSITATKINVDDLVAFDATIGGFKITDDAIHSVVKTSALNTTRGVYMNNDGEMSFGDGENFVRFYKDAEGAYKLDISADSLSFGTDKKQDLNAAFEVSKESILTEISGTYFSKEDGDTLRTDVSSALEQIPEGFIMTFDKMQKDIIENKEETDSKFSGFERYIRFIDGVIYIGEEVGSTEDRFEVVISNTKMSFLQNGSEIAYISNQKLYVSDAHITTNLRMANFEWSPRSNGNLTLRHIGG